ncbi:MAG: hypothetical protein KTR28_00890 [Micavibrio sp.]|nr:hypothetical protein [Micavibrio sp.]
MNGKRVNSDQINSVLNTVKGSGINPFLKNRLKIDFLKAMNEGDTLDNFHKVLGCLVLYAREEGKKNVPDDIPIWKRNGEVHATTEEGALAAKFAPVLGALRNGQSTAIHEEFLARQHNAKTRASELIGGLEGDGSTLSDEDKKAIQELMIPKGPF